MRVLNHIIRGVLGGFVLGLAWCVGIKWGGYWLVPFVGGVFLLMVTRQYNELASKVGICVECSSVIEILINVVVFIAENFLGFWLASELMVQKLGIESLVKELAEVRFSSIAWYYFVLPLIGGYVVFLCYDNMLKTGNTVVLIVSSLVIGLCYFYSIGDWMVSLYLSTFYTGSKVNVACSLIEIFWVVVGSILCYIVDYRLISNQEEDDECC